MMPRQQAEKYFRTLPLVVGLLFALSPSCRSSRKRLIKTNDGYDFTYGGGGDNESWAGPRVGERIDLQRLKDRYGVGIKSAGQKHVMMIVLIDPECGACAAATDQLQGVHDRVAEKGVPYYLVSVTSSVSAPDFFAYADSFDLKSPAYLWGPTEPKPPSALYSMVLPSHLLLNDDGTILRKWTGTAISDYDRARMVNQIVSDTLAELHRTAQ